MMPCPTALPDCVLSLPSTCYTEFHSCKQFISSSGTSEPDLELILTLTLRRAGEREGNLVDAAGLQDFRCQPEPFLPPFELARQVDERSHAHLSPCYHVHVAQMLLLAAPSDLLTCLRCQAAIQGIAVTQLLCVLASWKGRHAHTLLFAGQWVADKEAMHGHADPQGWPAEAEGNVHCHLFSRKWPADAAPAVMDALQLMRVVS